ncbi:hypothetical protein [Bordetella sp. LUAb4]|uniref:hypothetical protein n=1 Tax=Bordetella sp. LUAb4 TaxID=2843195 RepID=UPI001E3603B3|nr:hypothetical protein [Bordetella sp. LUAb4]
MALLGKAALAMWWNMAGPMKPEFEDWHTHEHFPERLSVPGFLRSSRWTANGGGEGVFVIYELDTHGVLSSPTYLSRLNDPTPWSRKLMPYHRDMVRCQSHVLDSHGSLAGRHAVTLRLAGEGADGVDRLCQGLPQRLAALVGRPGVIGAHLLRHETPAIAQTTEQKIRGTPDQVADVVVVLTGYDEAALMAAVEELDDASLRALGASAAPVVGAYTLSHSALPADVA